MTDAAVQETERVDAIPMMAGPDGSVRLSVKPYAFTRMSESFLRISIYIKLIAVCYTISLFLKI